MDAKDTSRKAVNLLQAASFHSVSQDVNADSNDDYCSGNRLLGIGIDINEHDAIGDHAGEGRADDCALYASNPTSETGAADGGGGDNVEFSAETSRRLGDR